MARGPITSPESLKNLKIGGQIRKDNQDLAKAVAEAVSKGRTADSAVREFRRERPSSPVVRLMFPEHEEEDDE